MQITGRPSGGSGGGSGDDEVVIGHPNQQTTVPGNDESPTVSPDQGTIAFSTDRDGNWEIYKVPSGGGAETRLTNNPAADTNPAWSPDNSAIAFASSRNGGTRVWAMGPDGSAQAQISAGAGDYPAYSRDAGDTVRTFRSSLNILGDGFIETNGLPTWGMVRTPPLWGLRTRERLMHDGGSSSPPSNSGRQSFALTEAILRHAGQATASRNAFEALTPIQKTQLLRFLRSL